MPPMRSAPSPTVDADLIVVGNKRMKGAARLLGSVPNRVAHKAPSSVLIARTAERRGTKALRRPPIMHVT